MAEENKIEYNTIYETGLGTPAIANVKFPHPDTTKAYKFDPSDNATSSSVDGKTVISFDNSVMTTKVYKMLKSSGEVIGFFDKKVRENIIGNKAKSVSKTTKLSSKAKKGGMWGNSKIKATDSSKSKMNTGTEFEKDERGVVVNLDNKEYNLAKAAKRKKETDAYETEKIRNAVNVLKNEIPADINEIKSILSLLLKYLGLSITTATEEEIGDDDQVNATLTEQYDTTGAVLAKAYKESLKAANWDDWYANKPNPSAGVVTKVMTTTTSDASGNTVIKSTAAAPEAPKKNIKNTSAVEASVDRKKLLRDQMDTSIKETLQKTKSIKIKKNLYYGG